MEEESNFAMASFGDDDTPSSPRFGASDSQEEGIHDIGSLSRALEGSIEAQFHKLYSKLHDELDVICERLLSSNEVSHPAKIRAGSQADGSLPAWEEKAREKATTADLVGKLQQKKQNKRKQDGRDDRFETDSVSNSALGDKVSQTASLLDPFESSVKATCADEEDPFCDPSSNHLGWPWQSSQLRSSGSGDAQPSQPKSSQNKRAVVPLDGGVPYQDQDIHQLIVDEVGSLRHSLESSVEAQVHELYEKLHMEMGTLLGRLLVANAGMAPNFKVSEGGEQGGGALRAFADSFSGTGNGASHDEIKEAYVYEHAPNPDEMYEDGGYLYEHPPVPSDMYEDMTGDSDGGVPKKGKHMDDDKMDKAASNEDSMNAKELPINRGVTPDFGGSSGNLGEKEEKHATSEGGNSSPSNPPSPRKADSSGSERSGSGKDGAMSLEERRRSLMEATSSRNSFTGMSEGMMDQPFLHRIVKHKHFESVMSAFITVNCATMGAHAHQQVTQSMDEWMVVTLAATEHIFTAVFSLECILRGHVYGCKAFSLRTSEGRSNFGDACLVLFTGVLLTWVIPLMALLGGIEVHGGALETLMVLRAVRLVRLMRVFHRVPLFREAWMLIRGLSDSVRTLFWTCVVIFLVTYVFAIFGLVAMVTELQEVQRNLKEEEDIKKIDDLLMFYAGLDRLMFTLIQVLAQDSFHSFMRDTLLYVQWSWMYFYAYVAVACFVLMNLVTAIIVENALSNSHNDHDQIVQEMEKQKAKDMKELKLLFHAMDADGSGTLCWDEFKDSFVDEQMAKRWMLLDFQPADCAELFDLLDDGDGEIETEEFFDGLGKMKGGAQSKDVFRLQKTLYKVQNLMNRIAPESLAGSDKDPGEKDDD